MARTRDLERDEAFAAFMQSAQPGLLRAAFFLTGSQDAAHDLTQDALVLTYLAWPKIRADGAYAYARRILVNQRVDRWRRTSREVLTDHSIDPPARADDTADHRDQLVRLLLALPEQQRKVVVLRHLVDLSVEQTADELGLSSGTVKSHHSRAVARLQVLLSPILGHSEQEARR